MLQGPLEEHGHGEQRDHISEDPVRCPWFSAMSEVVALTRRHVMLEMAAIDAGPSCSCSHFEMGHTVPCALSGICWAAFAGTTVKAGNPV